MKCAVCEESEATLRVIVKTIKDAGTPPTFATTVPGMQPLRSASYCPTGRSDAHAHPSRSGSTKS